MLLLALVDGHAKTSSRAGGERGKARVADGSPVVVLVADEDDQGEATVTLGDARGRQEGCARRSSPRRRNGGDAQRTSWRCFCNVHPELLPVTHLPELLLRPSRNSCYSPL